MDSATEGTIVTHESKVKQPRDAGMVPFSWFVCNAKYLKYNMQVDAGYRVGMQQQLASNARHQSHDHCNSTPRRGSAMCPPTAAM
jgi:hypothetical protein